MYALSWLSLAVAVSSLLLGLGREGLTLIYLSIGASVAAMVFLVLGLVRRPSHAPDVTWVPATSAPEPGGEPAARSDQPEGSDGAVVAIPARRTYHRPECSYAGEGRGAETIALAEARERGFRPCTVCRPDRR